MKPSDDQPTASPRSGSVPERLDDGRPAPVAEPTPASDSGAVSAEAMTSDEVAALLDGHAAEVIDVVASADRADDLDALETGELAGKSRKTVLEAIQARRESIRNL